MNATNHTHDPSRRSWVPSANVVSTDFPLQNLPFGRFSRAGTAPRGGVAIGDRIVDLAAMLEHGLVDGLAADAAHAAAGPDLTPLLALGTSAASALRAQLFDLLAEDGSPQARAVQDTVLVMQADVDLLLPARVRQFSDMCASTFHMGRRNGNDDRGQPICAPAFRTLPVGYDGRASSIVVSGTPVHRPNGIWQPDLASNDVSFGPEPRQDYELEMGLWLGGQGNVQGQPLSMRQAAEAMFGLCLLNDWSARGIQRWEMLLGPFLGKSFATTLSPWIVTMEALAPFRVPAFARPEGDPAVPAHLDLASDQQAGSFDIALTASLQTTAMLDAGQPAEPICRTNFSHMYWTFAQMVAHHASNGCALAAGDVLGSGTCSGPAETQAACLVERNASGPLRLSTGEERAWIDDGDTIVLSARAERDGWIPIGFGEARGQLLASPPWPR